MPLFVKGGGTVTPFGRNEYLRSTHPEPRKESHMLAAATVSQTTDSRGFPVKILQPGTVLAKITSGPNIGKVGPFQAAGTAEQQTLTKGGTWTGTGGTYRLAATGGTTHVDVPVADTAAQVAALVNALPEYAAFVVSATGGPLGTAPIVLTFTGDSGVNVPDLTIDTTLVTGGTSPTATAAQTTAAIAGAVDGRQTAANIVGLNDTFLPWQLLEGDREVAVSYDSTVAVQAWCFEYDAAGNAIPLSNTTADTMRGLKKLNVNFS